ncbi:hypothetical protein MSHO_46230 [Mycobacterium shottsii]|uniref:Uncharacterized protein n=1 Tax=Mycobacterium shottsii TaxID=133549 RepID=A0A7I7LHG6_9MYCO|nr:hypothetical protein MSHO_46230 [Mycobacterium shottsii]
MNVIDIPQVDLGTEATISPDVDNAGEHLKTWSRATGIVLDVNGQVEVSAGGQIEVSTPGGSS